MDEKSAREMMADAKAKSSSKKPLLAEMIATVEAVSFEMEAFQVRAMQHLGHKAPTETETRQIVVLDSLVRFLDLIRHNESKVKRVLSPPPPPAKK